MDSVEAGIWGYLLYFFISPAFSMRSSPIHPLLLGLPTVKLLELFLSFYGHMLLS